MKYRLNRKSLERLKALIRAGKFVDAAWSFTVADSNALAGDPINYSEFQQWFLGYEMGKPDTLAGNGQTDAQFHKDWVAYPFGKGDVVNVQALKDVARQASAAGESDIADAAKVCLGLIEEKQSDAETASGKACDVDISFGAPVHVKAAAVGKVPTFDADAYTGVAMTLEGFNHPVVIDYDGLDFTAHSRPVLRDHDPKRPIGHTTGLAVASGVLKATGEISVKSPDAQEVVDAGKNKFPWQISVGAKVLKSQFVPEGDTAQANGKTWSGPVIIARQTSLREISFLTLGADDNTSARIAANAAKGGHMPALKKKFAAWAKARNIVMADMEDDGMASAAKAMYKAQMKCDADDASDEDDDGKDDEKTKDSKSAATPVNIQAQATAAHAGTVSAATTNVVQEIRAAAIAERQRFNTISNTLDEYRKDIEPAKFTVIEAKALAGEYDQTRTELECIKARRPTFNAPNINTGAGGQADGAIIAAAAARSFGVGEKMSFSGLNEQQANIAASMRSFSLHSLMGMIGPRIGVHVQAGSIDRDLVDQFLRADRASHRQQIEAHRATLGPMLRASSSAGFSTVSLSGINENLQNKMMLESFGLQISVVPDICFERDTNDFKPFKVYRLTAAGDFQPLGPGGELKNFGLQDESYSNQVTTKGVLLVLKREDIVNDDMGALTQSSQILGRKAALNREKTVITTLLTGLSTIAPGASTGKTPNTFNFISTGAKNYLTGGSSALGITSVQNARTKFLQQTDANGDPISILPDRLLIGPENEGVADNLFGGANLTVQALDQPASTAGTTAAQTGKQAVNLNQHKGKYRPVMSPFLGGASNVAGATATQWAILPSPAGGTAAIQVGYLRGQRTPIIKQVETDAIMLGLAYQAIYDFGVALLDYRCIVYSAGA